MKKITVSLLASLFFLISCGESEEQKAKRLKYEEAKREYLEYSQKMAPPSESTNEDIELLSEYFTKQNQHITDENGFRVRYDVKQSWEEVKLIAQSDSLTHVDRGVSKTKFLKLLVGKSKFTLIQNDEIIKNITLIAQIYGDVTIKEVVHEGKDPKIHNEQEYYFPELDDKSVRDEIVNDLTSAYFWMDISYHNDPGLGDANDKLGMEYGRTIKESGIFQYKSLNDYTL